jgi:RimJ/RimL family protein N-acetyltransferase
MDLISAHWERRNLNLETGELSFQSSDTIQDLSPGLFESYEYLVAKVPSGSVQLVHDLESKGFRFIEAQFEISVDLCQPTLISGAVESLMAKISYYPLTTEAQVQSLSNRITPEMFAVDRVSIDPELGLELGAQRYRNWISDEFKSGKAFIYELRLGQTAIGFFVLRQLDEKVLFATLAGLYTEYKNKGLGLSIVFKPIQWAKENGYSRIKTRNSSNNSESFKIHLSCGYRLENVSYLLRWKRGERNKISEGALKCPNVI